MGFWSSVGSALSLTCSAIGQSIGSAVSDIGSAVSSFATGVGSVLGGLATAVGGMATRVASFATTLLQGLGILKPKENVEEMGERALQAKEADITMDQFDDFDGYMAALRDFELDPEKSAQRPQAEKLVAGLGVGTVGLEDKFQMERGSLNGMWLLPASNPDYFTSDRVAGLINSGRLQGDVFAYLENKLSAGDKRDLQISLAHREDGSPMDVQEKSELYTALDQAEETWNKLAEQAEQYQAPASI